MEPFGVSKVHLLENAKLKRMTELFLKKEVVTSSEVARKDEKYQLN